MTEYDELRAERDRSMDAARVLRARAQLLLNRANAVETEAEHLNAVLADLEREVSSEELSDQG